MNEFEEEDEEFFNDPALHQQLDLVENQFNLTQQQQQQNQPRPAKRSKLFNQSTQLSSASSSRAAAGPAPVETQTQTQGLAEPEQQPLNAAIHSTIIHLFQTLVVHPLPNRNLLSSIQILLDSTNQLSIQLKSNYDRLILDLFQLLSTAFEIHPDQDSFLLRFVARLSTIFLGISGVLCHTDLIEAQTETINIITILIRSSPLYTSFLLHHPDFKTYLHESDHNTKDILTIILSLIEVLITPTLEEEEDLSLTHTPSTQVLNNTNKKDDKPSDVKDLRLQHRKLSLAILDLLEALIWDPPEACYPTLENFLKSHRDRLLQFLLVKPSHQFHVNNEEEEDEEINELIVLEKSIDVLISLSSKVKLSKLILEGKVNETRSKSMTTTLGKQTSNTKKKEMENESRVGNKITVVDRIMKIYLIAATNQGFDSGSSVRSETRKMDYDRHSLKQKILTLLHLLAITDPQEGGGEEEEEEEEDQAEKEFDGWQRLARSSSSLFSILIKTIFVDSYRLWNREASIDHRSFIPKYIERIESSLDIIHKTLFPQSSSSTRQPLNLISRIKAESVPFSETLTSLSSSSSSSSNKSRSLFIIGNSNNIYHEFILCFSKLAWLDLLSPKNSSEFIFPWSSSSSSSAVENDDSFSKAFHCNLSKLFFNKLDIIAGRAIDLAYDVLSSVASPDELDEWKRSAIDEDDISDDDQDLHDLQDQNLSLGD
ncbi:hypothetical protein H4Q26_016451 [Puccinia striiformis f. sp. tritici PST-130]|nr:hypothetical protein H4Q26_016451 [Puccinia striiformis f. sp. tritici PST-130]